MSDGAAPVSLTGLTALVTGAGAGIGRAIAEHLGRAGATLLAIDMDESAARDVAEAVKAAGGRARWLALDIAADGAIDRIASFAAEEGALPTILVNNAAAGGGEMFEDVSEARFDRVFAVSTRATFFLTQRFVPAMKAARHGRIVNISSLIAARGTLGNPHYAGAKAAMIGFTRSWAIELAPFGITANVVPVAFTDTPMVRAHYDTGYREARIAGVPAGRIGAPEDVAELVGWLCSDAAAFVNGQAISPNGAEFVGAL